MDGSIILLIIIIVLLIILYYNKDNFTNSKILFKAPMSLTKLSGGVNFKSSQASANLKSMSERNLIISPSKLNEKLFDNKIINDVNFINMPSFFFANEKWPGCLPRPLFQGSCGSCWGFASVTCLSSRFFIESCGTGGCNNYPQINFGSVNQIYENLNDTYQFKKIYLDSIFKFIDVDKNQLISKDEWIKIVKENRKKIWNKSTSKREKYSIVQILVFMLDFQSMGSVNLGSERDVLKRAEKTYKIWQKLINSNSNNLDIKKLKEKWNAEPLMLSAEKLIACCINCMEIDFQEQATSSKTIKKDGKVVENPLCMGGTLKDAWVLLRDTGTTTTLCIGYNMDNYVPGDHVPSCREVQGPFYGFCSGYVFNQEFKDEEYGIQLRNAISLYEKSGYNPIAITNDTDVPWVDPQLFRFRAKNAYSIPNNMIEIQREILERGPVTTGFLVYEDFQYYFGQEGMGGQNYNGKNPLGGHANALIYMRNPDIKGDPIGGHAITIVGWGTYHYMDLDKNKMYKTPYWICLNSWGVEWGHSGYPDYNNRNGLPTDMTQGGYFWLIRGINNCEVEDNFTAGQPNIENITYPGIIDTYGWGLPGPDSEKVDFLPPLDVKSLELAPNNDKLEILPAISGGGLYIDFVKNKDNSSGTWEMKSMDPPSPYVMFWPSDRPIFCIGYTKNDLKNNIKDNTIVIDSITHYQISKIIKQSPTPLMIIGSGENQEQIQLIKLNNNNIYVNRGVNYNKILNHKKGSFIKVFPYQNLELDFFKNNGFKQCSMFD